MSQSIPPYKWFAGLCLIAANLAFTTVEPVITMAVAPSFIDPAPGDVTVACIEDVPLPIDLTADDGAGGEFEVSPVDTPDAGSINPCAGGVITRTWTAIVGLDTVAVSQQITVLADATAPIVNLAAIMDTVMCELALPSAPNNPQRYDVWLSSLMVAVSTNTSDNCMGVINIVDDGGAVFDKACETRTITFTLSDQCNNISQYVATYTSIDTIAPQLAGVPGDTTLTCTEVVPAPAAVTATDNCTSGLIPAFLEVSTQTSDGGCTDYEYNIFRTWIVSDSCGNSTIAEQVISILDESPPTYTTPANITISCTDDPEDLMITGNVTNVIDNCSTGEVSYTDQVTQGLCEDEMTITRFWRVTDVCGNSSQDIQIINVADLLAPTFTVPADITVDCSEEDELAITGEPVNVIDDCDPDPDVSFTDSVFPGACENAKIIRRSWQVTDRCGQATIIVQEITVEDQQPPFFTALPQSMLISCILDQDIESQFDDWINNRAQATADDNCSLVGDITWQVFNSGTTDAPSLETQACPVADDIVIRQDIDFIITDECGLKDTATVSFTVLDQAPPSLNNCPADFSVSTDTGLCAAIVRLDPPVITDDCSSQLAVITALDTEIITSQAAPGQEGEVAVDPVNLSFVLGATLPLNVSNPGQLTINLISVDAESPDEYFNIFGEDGSLIGQTDNTATSCGNGQTIIALSANQINEWGIDGVIDIRLEPNIPIGQPERFAINANCPNLSLVQASLNFSANLLNGIVYQYSIDGGNRINVPAIQAVDVNLDLGTHLIRYFAIDCAQNIDSCSFTVEVTDNEAPVLNCPAPITVSVDPDSCQMMITLPMPVAATDNCQVLGMYQRTLPATQNEALLNFFLDPNLNDFLPQPKFLSFDDVAANVYGDVTLTIDMRGDFNTNAAFVNILGDDGSTLGTTNVGIADCINEGQLILTIPAATFNNWAVDGVVNIEIVPNDITVPPGVLGDGINPCNAPVVINDGDTDGTSYITATISYGNLQSSYYATGDTPLPLAVFPESGILSPTFNVGLTEVFYITTDLAGNADTCSYEVRVEDVTPPTVLCSPTNLFINPSGFQVEVIDAGDVDAGSFDNCGTIDSLWLTPNVFACDQIGQIINVTLNARDTSGNIGTCQTIVGIAADGPMPTANSGLCGGDTLFLVANPPGPSTQSYLYQWFGPNGTALSPLSSEPNLEIVGIDAGDQGPYRVEITGFSQCTADGVVIVNIEELPLTPVLELPPSICTDDDLLLETPLIPAGTGVQFYWYEGIAPNGVLLGTTVEPMFVLTGPHTVGIHNFYMELEANNCLSPPSALQQTVVYNRPVATVAYTDSLICAGDFVTLGVASQSDASYNWTGPNGYTASIQFPNTNDLEAADGGFYFVTVSRGECTSAPDSTLITVKPRPDPPTLNSNAPICAEETLLLTSPVNSMSLYEWESPLGQINTTNTPSFSIPVASEDDRGSWRLRVSSNGCVSAFSETIGVVIHPKPVASAGTTPNPACEGDDVVLQAFSTVAGSTFMWSGPNDYTSLVQSPTLGNITEARAGVYKVIVTTSSTCVDSTVTNIDVFESVAIVGISDNIPACVDDGFDILLSSSTFPVDNGSYTYEWTFNGGNSVVFNTPTFLIPGATPDDNGTYVLEVFTENGCSSGLEAITVDLNFLPPQPTIPMTISGQLSFCEGETMTLITSAISGIDVQYIWSTPAGTIITTENMLVLNQLDAGDDGDYQVSVIRQGCASSTSPPRNITVHPIPQLGISSNSPVCEGDVISLQTTLYLSGEYTWSGPSAFESSISNPVVNNADSLLHTGTYRVFVNNFGCLSDTVSIDVMVQKRPAVPIVSHDAAICLDDPQSVLTLNIDSTSAVSGANYSWFINNGATIINTPTEELIYEVIDFADFEDGGAFSFFAYAELDGCTSALSSATIVQFDTIPVNQAFAGQDTTVCSGDYQLEGATPTLGTGIWTLISATNPVDFIIANPDDAQSMVSGLDSASAPYVLQWTISNGACRNYSSDSLLLDIINIEIAEAGDDILVCEDELVILGASPVSEDAVGYWMQDITQITLGVVIVEPDNPSTEITGLGPDNAYFFKWIVESVCGTTDETIIVNVSDPNIDAGPDVIVCDNINEVEMQGSTPTTGSVASWYSLDPELDIINDGSPNAMIRNLKLGENILIWEVDNGFCGGLSRDTISILYKLPPVLEDDVVSVPFGMPVDVFPLSNDQVPPETGIAITIPAMRGEGIVQNETMLTYTPPPNYVGIDELTYSSVSEGCPEATALIVFFVGDGAACKVPSIFTPNGDDYNDKFVIPCLLDKTAFPKSQVVIFNKWGDEVFRSSSPYEGDWGGTFSSEDLPVATYFYVVDLGDGSEPLTGYVMIQR